MNRRHGDVVRNTGILTYELFHGGSFVGSSRIRAEWVVNHWPEAELFTTGRRYETVIFQKVYWPEFLHMFHGIKILDLCDPDFLRWYHPLRSLLELCDAATTSSPALAEFVAAYTKKPVLSIPDRIDLDTIGGRRKAHQGCGPARIAAWFGYSQNFLALDTILPALPDYGITKLIVIATKNTPYCLPSKLGKSIQVENRAWEVDTVLDHLLDADVVLNPRGANSRWRFKSNNKSVQAWALGLPVAHTPEELGALIGEEARIAESERRLKQVADEYDVRRSVEQYQSLIGELQQGRMAARTASGAG
jgi:hypothetical protein